MKHFFMLIALCYAINLPAQPPKPADRILYGRITTDSLTKPPYDTWFTKNYNDYTINPTAQQQLQPTLLKGITIKAFFGSWCGDSKRELPRLIKVLDGIGFNKKSLEIVATGGSDSLYKQSPAGDEKGLGIFKVPVFIVYKDGRETGRINEFPVETLERDLLAILTGSGYTPNYKSFATLNKWLNTGVLSDTNTTVRGLSMQIKNLIDNEYELNSLGFLLLKHKQPKEALTVFKINAALFPNSANVLSSLGEAYLTSGEKEKAIVILEKSLELNPTPVLIKSILELLYKAKGL